MSAFLGKLHKASTASKQSHTEFISAVHNLTEDNLLFNHKWFNDQIVAPSMAVVSEHGMSEFGAITLFAGENLAEKTMEECYSSDIYTPRSPDFSFEVDKVYLKAVVDELNDIASEIINKDPNCELSAHSIAHALSAGMRTFKRHSMSEPAMKYAFAKHKGIEPEYTMKRNLDSGREVLLDTPIYELLKSGELNYSPDNESVVLEALQNGRSAFKAKNPDKRRTPFCKYFRRNSNDSLLFGVVDQALMDLREYIETPEVLDTYGFSSKLTDIFFEYEDEYDEWMVSKMEPSLTKILLRVNDEYGEYKDLEATPEFTLEDFKARKDDGEGFCYGMGNVRASVSSLLGDMDAIWANKHLLVDDDEMKVVKNRLEGLAEKFEDELFEACNYDADWDSFQREMFQCLPSCTSDDLSGLDESFNLDELSDEAVESISELLNVLSLCETRYFEAKLYENVPLSDFKAAIVPDNSHKEVFKVLEESGITNIQTYKSGCEDSRLAVYTEMSQSGCAVQSKLASAPVEAITQSKTVSICKKTRPTI
ncbi:hypothetical protein VCHA53O466_50267 [Vibrio chagasii]|nr:hypothetical protein VCHA53O466_50267 [Vibrio chagasii]